MGPLKLHRLVTTPAGGLPISAYARADQKQILSDNVHFHQLALDLTVVDMSESRRISNSTYDAEPGRRPRDHRVHTPEQDKNGKPVARVVMHDAVSGKERTIGTLGFCL